MRNGRGRKEQSQYATKGQPKGTLKEGGGGSEKRKGEKGAVTVCHTGATKGNIRKGRRKWDTEEGERSHSITQGQSKGT